MRPMMRQEGRSLYFTAPYQVDIRHQSLEPPGAEQVRVKTLVSAISAGTELLFYRGQVPPELPVDATIEALRGELAYPLKYGYATVGRVTEVGQGAGEDWIGRLVFVFRPHESHFTTDVDALHLVPEGITPETAVFLPLMETAVSFLMDGQPLIGERVVVLGQGVVGLLTTALLSAYPLSCLLALDRYALRRRWAREMGAGAAFDPGAAADRERLQAYLTTEDSYEGADLVYELSGNPQALDEAIALAGYDGRVLIGSWYGQKRAPLDLGGNFHRRHIQLLSSQVSHIHPRWRGRFDKARRLRAAWSALRRVDPQRLITHRFALEEAAQAYALLDRRPQEALQVILTYEAAPGDAA